MVGAGRRSRPVNVDAAIVAQDDAVGAGGGLLRNHAEANVLRDQAGVPVECIAKTATARHFDDHGLMFWNRLLPLALERCAGSERQRAGHAVGAAVAAAWGIDNSVVIRRNRERGIVQ